MLMLILLHMHETWFYRPYPFTDYALAAQPITIIVSRGKNFYILAHLTLYYRASFLMAIQQY